jgi:multimeric flavodoxin WrbA
MHITILNGEPDAQSIFPGYLDRVACRLRERGQEVSILHLNALRLRGCTGCFGCWVKTPGECVQADDSGLVCRTVIHSDLVVLASPLILGFTSALLKRAVEQMIPLIHPYIEMEGGEMHHRARYRRYPLFALLLGEGGDSEDVEISAAMWSRLARNLKSRLAAVVTVNHSAEEAADAFALVA